MRNAPKRLPVTLAVALAASTTLQAAAPSPYAEDTQRAIKALSAEDIQAYLAGKGQGLARAAELNGYPGPRHVLDLAAELALSREQRVRTQRLFDAMQADAQRLGRALVDAEAALDRHFANRSIDAASLAAALDRIGALQADLRGVHLQAHLAQVGILTPEQIARYDRVRGYASQGEAAAHHAH
jgi:Spy/CpxP family protein refolding chaperone